MIEENIASNEITLEINIDCLAFFVFFYNLVFDYFLIENVITH